MEILCYILYISHTRTFGYTVVPPFFARLG